MILQRWKPFEPFHPEAPIFLARGPHQQNREGAVERIAPLDAYAHYVPLAWQVRMVAALFSGENKCT